MSKLDRRTLLKGTLTAAGAAAFSMAPWRVFADDFPSRNIQVYAPTREGGGVDRHLRAFSSVWKNYLGTNFETSFYPGAAGRVGYEKYMGLAKDDCYELLFGNMGPEVLNWVVKKPTFDVNDYFYFARVDADPGILFVAAESKLQNIDDIIAAGKQRTLNVGVSRLAHPASLGALAVARHAGAKFNLIPLSGGRNTLAGVKTGEMDFGALPTGSVVSKGKAFKVVLVFDDKNPLPERMNNAPTANGHLGTSLPPLIAGSRAFGIKKSAADKHPDRFEKLTSTLTKVYTDPDYKTAYKKTKAPWEFIKPGGRAECTEYVKNITEIGEQFKDLLTGKTG